MEPIRVIETRTVVIPRENIDTDQIIPGRFLKVTDKKGLGKGLFSDWRYDAAGQPRPDFVLNRPEAQGCRVLGIDHDADRLALARSFGAEVVDLSAGGDPRAVAGAFSRGRGVDAVIIAASTTSDEPVHQAAEMCRKRGRIVLVGVTGLALSRADFYEKELSFQVSCSYGPGRYDPAYEDKGQDYPVGFVRWTEQRNFEAVLDMLADSRLDVAPLISHRFPLEQAEGAYAVVGGAEPSLGILLEYPPATGRNADVAGRFGKTPAF